MSTSRHHTAWNGPRGGDRGSSLPLVMVLMVVGSIIVLALLNFSSTLARARPPIETRDRTFVSAKAAMEMAISLQRAAGPENCMSPQPISVNGFSASVTCTETGNVFRTGNGRYAVVTTSNDSTSQQIAGNGSSADAKPITGNVFINGGLGGLPTSDVELDSQLVTSNYSSPATDVNRYGVVQVPPLPDIAVDCSNPLVKAAMLFPNVDTDWTYTCQSLPWHDVVGDRDGAGDYQYPTLPPLPILARPSVHQLVDNSGSGPCKVFYPGRYKDPVDLTGTVPFYFPSGVYYFEEAVTLGPDVVVVAGNGRFAGCTVDDSTILNPSAPSNPQVTGRGATFLLGKNATIVSNGASLKINRRVASPQTRASHGYAIRSVNFDVHDVGPDVEIPDDVVYLRDDFAIDGICDPTLPQEHCYKTAQDHRVNFNTIESQYVASQINPNQDIIRFDQSTGAVADNAIEIDGNIFVPNGRVNLIGGTNSNYRMKINGGIVTSGLDLDYDTAPANANNWFVGVDSVVLQRQVKLVVDVIAPNASRTISRATIQVGEDTFAINSWTVDPVALGG